MTNHVLVIYNPTVKSQVQTEAWMGQLVQKLNETGHYLVTFFPTKADTNAKSLVPLLMQPLDLVIAAGGDGTVRFAIAALAIAKSSVPLAVFPLGTGNVLARNLGVVDEELFANPLEHAFEYVSQGTPMPLDIGMMNAEYFGGMAGVGPLSDAFMTPCRDEKTSGKLFAYMKAFVRTIAMRPRVFKITTGGKSFKVQASGVFVTNVQDLGIGKSSDLINLYDGYLDLHIVHPTDLKDYVGLTRRYGDGVVAKHLPDYVMKVRDVVIEVVPRQGVRSKFQNLVHKIASIMGMDLKEPARGNQMKCMIDGDEHGVTPMHVTIAPKKINILVPPKKKTEFAPGLLQFPNRKNEPHSAPALKKKVG